MPRRIDIRAFAFHALDETLQTLRPNFSCGFCLNSGALRLFVSQFALTFLALIEQSTHGFCLFEAGKEANILASILSKSAKNTN